MPATTETGHAKNIANFQSLIAFVIQYGGTYNPSKTTLKLANLQARLVQEQTNLTDVLNKTSSYNIAVNQRFAKFANVKSLATRLVNALATTDAAEKTLADAKGFNRKIQGKRASAVPSTPTDPAATPVPKTISASQQSYDQQTQHLSGLVAVLQNEPSYAPNETDLQVVTLKALIAEMVNNNNEVATQYAAISTARMARDKGLYLEKTGLVSIAQDVKDYVKSVFGATSPEYKQISGIKFKQQKVI
ncbi:hypothetical protein ACFOWM_01570 [Ferruginibacter yonginensis]|uniref:Uncharacterized protein n=1 Tax=Ferruginibacter yonginensis TaxID=1310416 RepID=A0ABV8QRH5_9BACT